VLLSQASEGFRAIRQLHLDADEVRASINTGNKAAHEPNAVILLYDSCGRHENTWDICSTAVVPTLNFLSRWNGDPHLEDMP
jgi:long-subunit fatty acid transport protein